MLILHLYLFILFLFIIITVDMNKHLMPTTQSTTKSPNNYSISTLHYMERYHLIGPDKNLTSGIHLLYKYKNNILP